MKIEIERENRNVHFIIDCDGVLLDWVGAFRNWCRDHRGIVTDGAEPNSWSLAAWLGVSESKALELIREFNGSEHFAHLLPIPGSVEAVRSLKAAGHKLTVLSSCSSDSITVTRRRENLVREFGSALDRIVCLDLAESKSGWLEALRSGIWIEDSYKNALMGLKAGHNTFMMRCPHNREDERSTHPHIRWVDDWRPIKSLFG